MKCCPASISAAIVFHPTNPASARTSEPVGKHRSIDASNARGTLGDVVRERPERSGGDVKQAAQDHLRAGVFFVGDAEVGNVGIRAGEFDFGSIGAEDDEAEGAIALAGELDQPLAKRGGEDLVDQRQALVRQQVRNDFAKLQQRIA
jgi:hypothetical protein